MTPILKKVGGFLLNLILTNKRETLPGQTITEVEKTSEFLGLNLNDLVKGLLMAVLGAVVGDILASLETGSLVIDWHMIKIGAIVAGVAYLKKQLFTASKTILKIIVLGLLFSIPAYAQNNITVKALQSWNADSTTVRVLANLDSIMGRETGWLYFNNVTRKWRVGIATPDSVLWFDLISEGGNGNVTGNFTVPRIPYATGPHSLGDVPNMIWDTSTDRQLIVNDAGDQTTSTFGGQTSWEEPDENDFITASIGNGGTPYIHINDGTSETEFNANGATSASALLFAATTTNTLSSGGNVNVSSVLGDIELNAGGDKIHEIANYIHLVGHDSVAITNTGHPLIPIYSFKENGLNAYQNFELNTYDQIVNAHNYVLRAQYQGNSTLEMYADLSLVLTATEPGGSIQLGADNLNMSSGNGNFSLDGQAGSIIAGSGTLQLNAVADDLHLLSGNNVDIQSGAGDQVTITQGSTGPFPAHWGPQATPTFDFPSTLSLGESTLTTTITGQANGLGCLVNAPTTVGVYTCRIAAGTIDITFHNTTSGIVDPASGTFRIVLFRN